MGTSRSQPDYVMAIQIAANISKAPKHGGILVRMWQGTGPGPVEIQAGKKTSGPHLGPDVLSPDRCQAI